MHNLGSVFRKLLSVLLILGSTKFLSGCVVNPPPAFEDSSISSVYALNNSYSSINIGVDYFGMGFNPHLLSHLSELNDYVAKLTLPSLYVRRADNSKLALNHLLADRVSTASTAAGFQVSIEINRNAQWSDGVPITGDDFYYLWKQMLSTREAIKGYLYQNIKHIYSKNAGKTVLITFFRPQKTWPELFTNLLPSHLLKSMPGGFEFGLDQSAGMPVPASGGPFKFQSLDWNRGELILVRNDRFWGKPSVAKNIIFKRLTDKKNLFSSFESGTLGGIMYHDSFSKLHSGLANSVKLSQNDQRYISIIANTRTRMRDEKIRKAVFSIISGSNTGLATEQLLKEFFLNSPLKIAFLANDGLVSQQANRVYKKIKDIVNTTLVPTQHADLYTKNLINGQFDLLVSWQKDVLESTDLASKFTCVPIKRDKSYLIGNNLSTFCLMPPLINSTNPQIIDLLRETSLEQVLYDDKVNFLLNRDSDIADFLT